MKSGWPGVGDDDDWEMFCLKTVVVTELLIAALWHYGLCYIALDIFFKDAKHFCDISFVCWQSIYFFKIYF